MKFSSVLFVLSASVTRAFVVPAPSFGLSKLSMAEGDETDFDAPVERRMAVGNVVREEQGVALDHEIVVEDECYTGKDDSATDCVDFDPPHA